jgi:hypothetical protein
MTSAEELERFYSNDFLPEASRMLENRKGGITIDEGCLELIDNAEDAGSSETNTYLECDKYNNLVGVWVLDNGKSMNSEELFNAVRLPGKDINKAHDSIGKYHTGLKNATIGIGNDIYVVAKRGNEYRAIYMNIKNMQNLNTFRPTAYWNDEKTITNNLYNKHIWDIFKEYKSGTLIYVKNIHPHISTNINKVYHTLKTNIIKNYTKLKATLYITTITEDKIKHTKELKIEDVFYNKSPDKIETCYETTLLYYEDKTIIEKLESSRARGSRNINGTKNEPKYYRCEPGEGKKLTVPFNKNHIEYKKTDNELTKYLEQKPLGTIKLKFISVTSEAYSDETKLQCDDDGESEGESTRRKGIYFMRDTRVVSKAHLIGMNLDDHHNRLRMSVTYPPELDLEFGCTTQKQINNLNSSEIRDALMMIYKQCATKIVSSRKEEKKQKKQKESNKQDNEYTEEDNESAKEDNESAKEDNKSTEEDNESTKEDNKSTEEDIESTKEDIESTKEDIESTKEDNDSTKEDDESTKEDNDSTKEDNESTKEDNDSTKEDIESTKEDNDSTKEDIESTKEDNDSTKEDNESTKDIISSNNEDNASANEDNASAKEDNESTKEDDDKLRRQKKISEHITGLISGAQLKELLENTITKIDPNKNYYDEYVKFYNLGVKLFEK